LFSEASISQPGRATIQVRKRLVRKCINPPKADKQALVLLSRHRDPYALDANLGYTWAGGRRFRFRSVSAGLSFGPLGAGAELVWADGLEGREHWIPMLYASFNAGKDFIPTLAVQRDTWPGGHAWIVILGATVRLWH